MACPVPAFLQVATPSMSEDEIFENLVMYYDAHAKGAKTEGELRKMAAKVAIVSARALALSRPRRL